MWRRHISMGSFWSGFPPYGFHFCMRPFPRHMEHIKMLEDYRKELQGELAEIAKELEDKKGSGER